MLTIRAVRLVAACLMPVLVIGTASAQVPNPPAHPPVRPPARRPAPAATGGVIQAIKVEGNQRIEAGTIRSYLLVQPGDAFDPDRIDRSLKTLYATGLFQDVRLGRVGDDLVVRVVENPIVNRVAFENNHKLSDDQLRTELQLRPRAVFTPALAEADRQKILDLYAKRGSCGLHVTMPSVSAGLCDLSYRLILIRSLGFYALGIGLGFVTLRHHPRPSMPHCFYALGIGLGFATLRLVPRQA